MQVFVGTSGYSYEPWRGSFYPPKFPTSKMLGFYASRFSTVEINNTFYRMPTAAMVSRWLAQVPPGFVFSVKAPQQITHKARLWDCTEAMASFLGITNQLGTACGPLLFQLPPFFKKDIGRLKAFCDALPDTRGPSVLRVAFEFRHKSWFDEEVYAALREANAAMCFAEGEEVRGEGGSPSVLSTCNWGYLRLRMPDYDELALGRWAERILKEPWDEAFVYLKHEDEGKGPAFAEMLRRALGPHAAYPQAMRDERQGALSFGSAVEGALSWGSAQQRKPIE